jgi:hypothetical protein
MISALDMGAAATTSSLSSSSSAALPALGDAAAETATAAAAAAPSASGSKSETEGREAGLMWSEYVLSSNLGPRSSLSSGRASLEAGSTDSLGRRLTPSTSECFLASEAVASATAVATPVSAVVVPAAATRWRRDGVVPAPASRTEAESDAGAAVRAAYLSLTASGEKSDAVRVRDRPAATGPGGGARRPVRIAF